jgi:hypothetical protein
MKNNPCALALATLASITMTLAALPSLAQTEPKAAKKPPAKAAPKAAAKPAAKAAAHSLPAASPEQMTAFGIAHQGRYPCELGDSIDVVATPKHEGYLDVLHKGSAFTMKPVLSSTGALRLEDVRGRMLMIQIANKSMLMDTQAGQRVVDGCVHEKQRDFANRPAAPGLGIEPAKAASAPA